MWYFRIFCCCCTFQKTTALLISHQSSRPVRCCGGLAHDVAGVKSGCAHPTYASEGGYEAAANARHTRQEKSAQLPCANTFCFCECMCVLSNFCQRLSMAEPWSLLSSIACMKDELKNGEDRVNCTFYSLELSLLKRVSLSQGPHTSQTHGLGAAPLILSTTLQRHVNRA